MKRITGLLAATVLSIVAVVPAGADTEVPLHGACTKADPHLTVGAVEGTIETPALPLDETTATFVVDLEGQPTTKRANISIDMTWGDPTDFELDANGESSASFNFDGSGESVSLSGQAHCSIVTVTATNFTGNPLATLDLDFRTTAK